MTVKSVWGRIQRRTATLIQQEGDKWTFQVPPWAASPLIVEFWAEDEAGNVSYRTGVFTFENGETKCIKWKKDGSSLVMLPDDRATIMMLDAHKPQADLLATINIEALDVIKPRMDMLDHACSKLIEVSI